MASTHGQLPPLDTVSGDSLIGSDLAAYSPSRPSPHASSSNLNINHGNNNASSSSGVVLEETDESVPLLGRGRKQKAGKKPFYRARPLWLVPFAVTAALVRGMTMAPRVEVFTQLSCNKLHGHHNWNHTQTTTDLYSLGPHLRHTSTSLLFNSSRPPHSFTANPNQDERDSDDTEDPRRLPSARCLADPAVQAGAARLQTIMTTTMGLLSALTTGWWGHFGERHGRTRVLAIATLGLFLTDLTFILVSTPSSPLSKHGHNLLLLAPIIEGLLGGWSALQSATSAYLSDCTSPGSRAPIFSRFQGVFYLGFALGPTIGGWLIKHPVWWISGNNGGGMAGGQSVTSVFWVAIICSFINFTLSVFVFPESLGKKKQAEAARVEAAKGKATATVEAAEEAATVVVLGTDAVEPRKGLIARFLSPLAVFLPVIVLDPSPNGIGLRKRRDWSLTMLAIALFGFMLSTGLYQIKYLYAVHTYNWGAEQLGYYISFMGGGRAVWLLFLLPTLIGWFKPKPLPAEPTSSDTNTTNTNTNMPPQPAPAPGKKPKPTRAQLGREIKFDLVVARCSLLIDFISHTLIAILPAPSGVSTTSTASSTTEAGGGGVGYEKSQTLFVLASSLNGMGSGAVPAIHSLALCMMQVRSLNAVDGGGQEDSAREEEGTGALFGALAVLQAVGQMILGPMLFGLIYSSTVAHFPKTIFVVGAGIMVFALAMMLCVRNPVRMPRSLSSSSSPGANAGGKRRRRDGQERGRSRVSKDLRGGAVAYHDYGSTTDESCV
ncbi:hypothetical protein GALMADRAFT_156377 [Galerina marginata CBS 339.88]|uniref:Major facilitator superfamily (MFS) profile domain-containing protein n=1 Tax=Galerina marginata (strain CBS 339.88) TaxID=685588 RepID=A0A067SZG7_GALM3|nr:hypothetical protein GALMADRAFT_156377 [Galerina marginata CBS 339.88]